MFLLFFCLKLEGIADCKVQSLHILETAEVEIAIAFGVQGGLWVVEGKSPVDADDEESQIVTQADACADGDVVEKTRWLELHHVYKRLPR